MNLLLFFMGKIRKIHNNLSEHPKFSPAMRDIQRFNKFEPMAEDEVARIINGSPTKTCELRHPTHSVAEENSSLAIINNS